MYVFPAAAAGIVAIDNVLINMIAPKMSAVNPPLVHFM
jgi:hypothetical protein